MHCTIKARHWKRSCQGIKVGCGPLWQGYSYVPPGDDEALMEAVYSRGPIAVSLDASQPGFRFYSEGKPTVPSRETQIDRGFSQLPFPGFRSMLQGSWKTPCKAKRKHTAKLLHQTFLSLTFSSICVIL